MGVVPRFCAALFEDGEQGLSVAASMLEIYNEKLRDLLVTSSESLRIREDPQTGPYAAGATVVEMRVRARFVEISSVGRAQ